MKTISLHQPWATLIASGAKRIETRDWLPQSLRLGQLVAIHAAKHWTADERELIADDPFFQRHLELARRRHLWSVQHPEVYLGGVVAIARFLGAFPTERLRNHITETERAFGNYGPGRYGWVFSEVRPLAIIPARGQQGLFDWDAPQEIANLYREEVNQPRPGTRMAALMEELRESLRYPTARVTQSEPAPAAATAVTGPTRVVHVRRGDFDPANPNCVYVGRQMPKYPELKASGWGNPFKVGLDTPTGRQSAIDRYRNWILAQPKLLARLPELRGRVLGCWCVPAGGLPGNLYGRVCHGEVLAALADGWCVHCNEMTNLEHMCEHEAAAQIALSQVVGALTGNGQFQEVTTDG